MSHTEVKVNIRAPQMTLRSAKQCSMYVCGTDTTAPSIWPGLISHPLCPEEVDNLHKSKQISHQSSLNGHHENHVQVSARAEVTLFFLSTHTSWL